MNNMIILIAGLPCDDILNDKHEGRSRGGVVVADHGSTKTSRPVSTARTHGQLIGTPSSPQKASESLMSYCCCCCSQPSSFGYSQQEKILCKTMQHVHVKNPFYGQPKVL